MTTKTVQIDDFLKDRRHMPVLDVRAPGEFKQGCVSNAVNIPLFDDEQRAQVGVRYKNHGRIAAVKLGLELIGPRMRQVIDSVEKVCAELENKKSPDCEFQSLLIYCARGGMRSDSMGWLLGQVDFDVRRLDGGYKSYRRAAQSYFERKWKLIAITGMTGAGKTELLHELAAAGEQVIDLEGLACHRGSAFGGVGQGQQPKTEQFENLIFERLLELDPEKRIWIEDESRAIGKCVIPTPFFKQFHDAPAVFIDVEMRQRAESLVEDYGALPTAEMIAAIERISKRLGGQHVKAAIESLQAGDLHRCAEILLVYYDKTYRVCQDKNPRNRVEKVSISDKGSRLEQVLAAAKEL